MNLTKPCFGRCLATVRHSSRLGCLLLATTFAFALGLVNSASAQTAATGTITGRVQNAVTGDALEHAKVTLQGTPIIVYTDEGGHFFIGVAPTGAQTLSVSYTGLDTKTVAVNVTAGQRAETTVELTSASRYGDTIKLDAFTVESHRETDAAAIAVNEQRYAPNIKSVVAADEFGPLVDQNPGELLKYLPGVDVDYFANNITGVSVRGLGSENTEINYDGLPVASMNAESVSRGMEVQYQSAADVGRVEIRKLPLPEDSANAIGGSINFVRKSAFEATRRRINYQLTFKADGEKLTLKDMDGPKDRLMPRWRPNWVVSWTEPVTKNFGFSVTVGQDDTLVNTHWSLPGWNLGSSGNNNSALAALTAGQPYTRPSIYTPGLRNPLNHNAPKMQGKDYGSVRVDWRPIPELTLGAAFSATKGWVQNADDIRYSWDAAATGSGDVNTYNDQTTYLGRVGGGEIYHNSPLWRDVISPTVTAAFNSKYRKGDWEASVNGSLSESRYNYYDTEHGFFGSTSTNGGTGMPNIPQTGVGSGTANPIPLTINFKNVDYWGPKTIEAWTTATGATSTNIADYTVPVAWYSNAVTKIGGARARPGNSKEIISSMRAYVQRYFNFKNPLIVKLGLDWYDTYRNRHYFYNNYRFIGPDNSSTQIAAVNLHARPDSEYDYPGSERISMTRLYSLYQQHPEWFQYDSAMSERANRTSAAAYDLNERTTAPYLQLDWRTLNNRLRMVGGVRYERVRARAHGLLTDTSTVYMHYANGDVVHVNDVDATGRKLVSNLAANNRQANYSLAFGPTVLPFYTPQTVTSRGAPVFIPAIQQAGNAQRLAYDNATGQAADQFNTPQARDPNYTLGYTNDTATNIGRSSLLYQQMVYTPKGAYGEGTNANYYPSIHVDYTITDNLQFQIGYARTQAKLNYNTVLIPGTSRDETIVTNGVGAGALGTINVNNPDLKPWTANNFDARLAYYTKSGGVFGLGAFTKRVKDIIVDLNTTPLTQADIDAYNALYPSLDLGSDAVGYTLATSQNQGNGQLDGAEIEVSQSLNTFLPTWARGFQVIGSSTYINRKGPNSSALGNNRAWVHKAILQYNNRKYFASVRWTYNGDWINNPDITSNGFHGQQITVAQNLVDFSFSYQLTRWAKLFVSGSDILDERRAREDQYAVRPAWSYMGSSNTFGVTYAVGVTGQF
jgi:TonB-dependent receptor